MIGSRILYSLTIVFCALLCLFFYAKLCIVLQSGDQQVYQLLHNDITINSHQAATMAAEEMTAVQKKSEKNLLYVPIPRQNRCNEELFQEMRNAKNTLASKKEAERVCDEYFEHIKQNIINDVELKIISVDEAHEMAKYYFSGVSRYYQDIKKEIEKR